MEPPREVHCETRRRFRRQLLDQPLARGREMLREKAVLAQAGEDLEDGHDFHRVEQAQPVRPAYGPKTTVAPTTQGLADDRRCGRLVGFEGKAGKAEHRHDHRLRNRPVGVVKSLSHRRCAVRCRHGRDQFSCGVVRA